MTDFLAELTKIATEAGYVAPRAEFYNIGYSRRIYLYIFPLVVEVLEVKFAIEYAHPDNV